MSRETLAIVIVVGLFGLFALLLAGSLIRARFAAAALKAAAEGAPPPAPEEPKKPKPVSRREFFRRSLLTSVGLFSAQFGAASLAFLWPTLRGGFGSILNTNLSPADIKAQIEQDKAPVYFGAGRLYLVAYEGSGVDEASGTDYAAEGLIAEGLMALYQKCVHLGCRVPFCAQSQWFECPCHGSKYNRVGEYRDGPAPRGMDRFPIRIEDGLVVVDTSNPQENGPPRGVDTTNQPPEGPFCINIGGPE